MPGVTRACKDCPPGGVRAAPHPGPRCASHHRARRKATSASSHERRVQKVYGLAPGQYDTLYRFQGGRCAICQRATGKARRLAVDHDHSCCPGPTSCGRCVRGLLCSPCNKDIIGRLDLQGLSRAYWYLREPPAHQLIPQAS